MTTLTDTAARQLQRIAVVLVRPAHPRNIGATARAMKSMGLRDLILVKPSQFPHRHANDLAVSAADVLAQARVCATLEEALDGARWAYGVSARERRQSLPIMAVRACTEDALAQAAEGPVCFVFGNEESGLDNADLALCQQQVIIPSDAACPSLNLASAVQVVCHELRQTALAVPPEYRQRTGAGRAELAAFHLRVDQALDSCGFYDNKNRLQAQDRLRALIERARPDKAELNLLLGMLAQLQRGGHPGPPVRG